MADVEVTGLRELAAALNKAESKMLPQVQAVVEKGALNIKQDWQRRWAGIGHAPALPAAISYDPYYWFGAVGAEIGPDKGRRQGALGNIIEFGTVNNAPIPGGLPSLEAEGPKFEKALEDLALRIIE